MTRTESNKPAVERGVELSRLLRHKWLGAQGLIIEVCDDRIHIHGNAWPSVYRIPDGMDWSLCWPGKPGLGAPFKIDGMLADIGPYLKEELIIHASDGNHHTRWSVMPGQANVKQNAMPTGKACGMTINPTDSLSCIGSIDTRARSIRIAQIGDKVVSMMAFEHAPGSRPLLGLEMSKRDTLLLALALLQVVAGSGDPRQLQQNFAESAFLLEEPFNGEEFDKPSDSGDSDGGRRQLDTGIPVEGGARPGSLQHCCRELGHQPPAADEPEGCDRAVLQPDAQQCAN